jgi:S1-C subfamily serine protease
MNSNSSLRISLISSVLGGALVAAVLVVSGITGGSDKTTTVVQQAPLAASQPAANTTSAGLTPREIYKRDAPGVVFIRATVVQQTQSPFDFGLPQQQQGTSTGSGFVIDQNGYILTNAHVIDGASNVTVQLEDNKSLEAKVVGKDQSTDLAVLKIDPKGVKLTPLDLGDSKNVQVGDATIAIGNPFGLDRTLTTGVVSALQREIQAPNGFSIDHVIQTDAAINPGNSGGPLIDATGKVIGINSQIETGGSGSGNVGIGFAVPIETAKKVIPQLRKDGQVKRAYLGISGVAVSTLPRLNLGVDKGVLVSGVTPGSPAQKAGIKGGSAAATLQNGSVQLGGDIITAVDGKAVAAPEDIVAAVSNKKPGDTAKVTIRRDGKNQTLDVKLAQRPNQATPTG